MSIPKRKNDINVYSPVTSINGNVIDRRQELLSNITKSDTFLPDSILHDDLDLGMIEFVKNNFIVISDNAQIPIIPSILTIQKWSEYQNNWSMLDKDNNIKIPFIAIVRKPDVQPGTNPIVQRSIPDRRRFFYSSVPTWNGTQRGADIYKIPQPVAIDISFEITIVCHKFRDLNKFNQKVLQKFSSRQAYTIVKGHYIPIVLDSIDDNTPLDLVDGRRFYLQNYKFTMLGFLIDNEEFEVKPAISRFFLMNEFSNENKPTKKYINKDIDITSITFTGDGLLTNYSVGEGIGILFSVTINGLVLVRDVDFYHITYTSKITFPTPPVEGSVITITYFKGRNSVIVDNYGRLLNISDEIFIYDGTTLTFTLNNIILGIVSVSVNGLQEVENVGYEIISNKEIKILNSPFIDSNIIITYLY